MYFWLCFTHHLLSKVMALYIFLLTDLMLHGVQKHYRLNGVRDSMLSVMTQCSPAVTLYRRCQSPDPVTLCSHDTLSTLGHTQYPRTHSAPQVTLSTQDTLSSQDMLSSQDTLSTQCHIQHPGHSIPQVTLRNRGHTQHQGHTEHPRSHSDPKDTLTTPEHTQHCRTHAGLQDTLSTLDALSTQDNLST